MKKLLALVLALVMTLSLCVTSNAAYTDAADIDYTEAVDVMSAIGVLQGNGGKFNPDGILTRAEACTIIAKMLGMGTYDGKSNFTDCQGHWGEGAIALCAGEGIVDGVGGGKFDPNGKLTGYAFAKMLLVALGYDAKIEGMTGFDWTIGVAKLIKSLDLNDGIDGFVGSAEVSREVAAQMALNALQCAEVYYGQSESVTNKGEITTSTNLKANKVDGSNPATDPYLELMEDYFPKLVKTAEADTADDFGRLSTKWSYKGVSIGTYASEPTHTYTAETKEAAIKADLKDYNNYNKTTGSGATLYTNGKDHKAADTDTSAATIAGLTQNGRVVEVYTKDNDIKAIVIVDTFLGKVTKVDKNAEKIEITLQNPAFTLTTTKGYGTFVKDDYVLVTLTDDNGTLDTTNTSFKTVTAPTKVTGLATSFNTTKKTVTVAGTTYDESFMVATNNDVDHFAVSAKNEATLYLDNYGYVIYAKAGAPAANDRAVAVTKTYQTLENGQLVWMAKGMTSNGEAVDWKIPDADSGAQGMYTYADADANGYYDLTAMALTTTADTYAEVNTTDGTTNKLGVMYKAGFTSAKTSKSVADAASQTLYFSSDVKFIYYDLTAGSEKVSAVDGVQKIADAANVYMAVKSVDDVKYVTAVFVNAAAPSSAAKTGDIVYVVGASQEANGKVVLNKDNKEKKFSTYTAYIDGKEVENFYGTADKNGFFYVKKDADTGAYVLDEPYTATTGAMAVTTDEIFVAYATDVMTTNAHDFSVSTIIDVLSGDGDAYDTLEEIAAANVAAGNKNVVVDVMYDADTNVALYVFVTDYLSELCQLNSVGSGGSTGLAVGSGSNAGKARLYNTTGVSHLTASADATIVVKNSGGTVKTTGNLAAGDTITVTAQDGVTSATWNVVNNW